MSLPISGETFVPTQASLISCLTSVLVCWASYESYFRDRVASWMGSADRSCAQSLQDDRQKNVCGLLSFITGVCCSAANQIEPITTRGFLNSIEYQTRSQAFDFLSYGNQYFVPIVCLRIKME